MQTTVEVERGKLIFTREAGRLIKVTYVETPIEDIIGDDDLVPCVHCKTFVSQAENGSYYDIADRFLCHLSPTSMHAGYIVTQAAV